MLLVRTDKLNSPTGSWRPRLFIGEAIWDAEGECKPEIRRRTSGVGVRVGVRTRVFHNRSDARTRGRGRRRGDATPAKTDCPQIWVNLQVVLSL